MTWVKASACPKCGAPIYEDRYLFPSGPPQVKYSCECRNAKPPKAPKKVASTPPPSVSDGPPAPPPPPPPTAPPADPDPDDGNGDGDQGEEEEETA